MALRIVSLIVVALSGSQAARTSLRATLQASELAHLQVLIANTTKALKESQAATAEKKTAPAAEKKTTEAEKKAPVAEKKAPVAEKKPEEAPKAQKPKPAFPQHVTKQRQAVIIKQLAAEEDMLAKNLKEIKAQQKKDKQEDKNEKHLEGMMKGKDADMLKNFDAFTKRANAKAAVGAQDVLSKLKHMIHFIKKGALQGDGKAADGLDSVLKDMSGMVR
jgi:outer membrane biosynthesis protein TonB